MQKWWSSPPFLEEVFFGVVCLPLLPQLSSSSQKTKALHHLPIKDEKGENSGPGGLQAACRTCVWQMGVRLGQQLSLQIAKHGAP